MTVSRGRGDLVLLRGRRAVRAPLNVLDRAGDQMSFYARAVAWTPRTLTHYRKEVLRLLAEVTFGSGALAVIGGTIGVIAMMSGFTGVVVGLQVTPRSSSSARRCSPASSRPTSTPVNWPDRRGARVVGDRGCGFTAQLGAMRISEEIDALEVMAVPSLPFLVTSRMIAGFVAVIPLYIIGLLAAYLATRTISTLFNGQSSGSYDHYFYLFLPPEDVLYSFAKVLVFAFVVILIHCYYGFHASGGPAGVGVAVGRAVRTAIVTIAILDFFLSLAIWGTTTTVRVAG